VRPSYSQALGALVLASLFLFYLLVRYWKLI